MTDLFFSPREAVGFDATPESNVDFINTLVKYLRVVLYPCIHKAIAEDPTSAGNFTQGIMGEEVTFIASLHRGFNAGGIELAMHANHLGVTDGFAIVSLRVPILSSLFCLSIDRIWGETPEIVSDLRNSIITYARDFNQSILENNTNAMPLSQVWVPTIIDGNTISTEIIKV